MIARIAATKESKTLTRLYKLYDKKYYIISQYNISNKIYFNKICLISCFFFGAHRRNYNYLLNEITSHAARVQKAVRIKK